MLLSYDIIGWERTSGSTEPTTPPVLVRAIGHFDNVAFAERKLAGLLRDKVKLGANSYDLGRVCSW